MDYTLILQATDPTPIELTPETLLGYIKWIGFIVVSSLVMVVGVLWRVREVQNSKMLEDQQKRIDSQDKVIELLRQHIDECNSDRNLVKQELYFVKMRLNDIEKKDK